MHYNQSLHCFDFLDSFDDWKRLDPWVMDAKWEQWRVCNTITYTFFVLFPSSYFHWSEYAPVRCTWVSIPLRTSVRTEESTPRQGGVIRDSAALTRSDAWSGRKLCSRDADSEVTSSGVSFRCRTVSDTYSGNWVDSVFLPWSSLHCYYYNELMTKPPILVQTHFGNIKKMMLSFRLSEITHAH